MLVSRGGTSDSGDMTKLLVNGKSYEVTSGSLEGGVLELRGARGGLGDSLVCNKASGQWYLVRNWGRRTVPANVEVTGV